MRAQVSVILLLSLTPRPSTSVTLSCFSYEVLNLPSIGLGRESDINLQSPFNFLESLTGRTTNTFDGCFWGLLSFVVFSVIPASLKTQVAKIQERISGVPHTTVPAIVPHDPSYNQYQEPTYSQYQEHQYTQYQDPAYTQYRDPIHDQYLDYHQTDIEDGTRRLDLNVYNYIDTSGPPNDISLSPPPSMYTASPSLYNPPPNPPSSPPPPAPVFDPQLHYQGVTSSPEYTPPQTASSPTPPIYSPPISSSLLQDDWEGKLLAGQTSPPPAAPAPYLPPRPLVQDYDDIDYTSGGLVTFHTSLSHRAGLPV